MSSLCAIAFSHHATLSLLTTSVPLSNTRFCWIFRANNSVALQEWDLVENSQHGKLEYTTKYSKFSSVCSLTLHFPSNFGADISTIFFIGLRGETTRVTTKQVIMNTVYESAPNVKDHKVDDATSMDVSPGM